MIRERADLLFQLPEHAFHAGTTEIETDDVRSGEGQIRTDKDETAFALPDEDKAEFPMSPFPQSKSTKKCSISLSFPLIFSVSF